MNRLQLDEWMVITDFIHHQQITVIYAGRHGIEKLIVYLLLPTYLLTHKSVINR